MSYLPLADMYERLAQVGKALTTATTKQMSFMARNLGLARADGTANQNKNMSHNTFNYRDYYENRLKIPITSLIQHALFTGNLGAPNEIHNIHRKS